MMNNNNVNRGRSSNSRQGYGGRGRNYIGTSRGGGFSGRSHGHSGGRGRGSGGGGGSGGGYNHSNKGSAGSYIHNIGISGNPSSTSFAVAVQGCSHGELDSIYEALVSYRRGGIKGREQGGRDGDGLVENSSNYELPNHHNNVDVLLCCGDVQTLRNADDFHSLAVPPKYKTMGDFHAYYSGQKVAPILTIMIGGNHEASNYLQELHYGGWVAPNIYYLGAAGVVNLCKKRIDEDENVVVSVLRIAGISGIYKANHYCLGRYEMPPYDNSSLRSVYHTREVDVKRMRSLSSSLYSSSSSSSSSSSLSPRPGRTLDIMITHDWPRGIANHGNVSQLLQQKPFFRQEVEQNELGSPAHEDLLYTLKPRYWFAAHLHVKFEAMVRHDGSDGECGASQATETLTAAATTPTTNTMSTMANSEDPTTATTVTTEFIGMESNEGMCPTPSNSNIETLTEQMTRFLSLDKCLPKRRHIQITHVEPSSPRVVIASSNDKGQSTVASPINDGGYDSSSSCNNPWLEYDVKWLAVLQRTHAWTKRTRGKVEVPKDDIIISNAEEEDVMKRFELHRDEGKEENSAASPLAIPQNFVVTAPPFNPTTGNRTYGPPPPMIGNPQTDRFLNILGMDHQITVPFVRDTLFLSPSINHSQPTCASRQLIPSAAMYNRNSSRGFSDGNEIALDDDDDDDNDDDGDDVNNGVHQDKLCVEQNQMKTKGEGTTCLDTINDPGEIELDELGDDGDAAGDSVCLKKPRMNS